MGSSVYVSGRMTEKHVIKC